MATATMTEPSRPGGRPRLVALACGVVVFAVLVATAPGLTIVWDEGEYLARALRLAEWLRLLVATPVGGAGPSLFGAETLRHYWQFVTWSEGHPAFGAVPTAMSAALVDGLVPPLTAARLGPMAVFSLAAGLVAWRLRQAYGSLAALAAVTALLTYPRLFAEAHFVTLDGQLTAWWLATWAIDAGPRRNSRDEVRISVLTGLLAGLTCAVKFSGWAVWAPILLARLLAADRRLRLAGLLLAVPVGLLIYVLVNPPLWHDFVPTLLTHLRLNTQRTLNISTQFLGQVYDLKHPLPWYNTLAWLVMATPLHLLVLGGVGVWAALRRGDRTALSLVVHASALLLVRAVPGTPPHDGVRLFLPALGLWCLLAGAGTHVLWHTVAAGAPRRRAAIAAGLALAMAGGAVNLARYYPQPLSHYSLLVGGLRGATALGMEPTYWWDALDRPALDWLNTHTAPDRAAAYSTAANIGLLRQWGWLTAAQADRRGEFQWYVLQNRPGLMSDADRELVSHAVPAYVGYAGGHGVDDVPWDLRVPLLWIFPGEAYHPAAAAGR